MLVHLFMWQELGLDDPVKRLDASMCFYLGYGVEETRRLLAGFNATELESVRKLAPMNGFEAPRDLIDVART